MKRQGVAIILALMTISCVPARHGPGGMQIHPGAGEFTFADTQAGTDKPMTVWYYRPSGFSRDMPVLFVMHGVKRDARRYRDEWIPYAERYRFLLIVPEFSHKYYPGKREYNEGHVFDPKDNPVPENDRAFTVIERLFDFVKETTQNRSPLYDIYGHSAGGQFVQRMILFKTDARIRMAVAANPGIYLFPVYSEKYPFGIRNSGITPDHLRVAFKREFILLLGEKDVMADDVNLARSPEALAQGHNRFERGNHFFDSSKNEAARLGMIFNWKLTTVPGAGHHDAQMAQTAADSLFIKGRD